MANENLIEELMRIKPDDISSSFLKKCFANTLKTKAKYKPNTHFSLPKGKYYNESTIDTTIGRFIFNKFLFEANGLIEIIGYQNIILSSDGLGDLEGKLSSLLMDDKITVKQFSDFLNRIFWLGFNSAPYLNPSLDYDILMPKKKVEDRKKQLLKDNKEALDRNDPIVTTQITNELTALAKEELKDSDAYRIYKSGAKGSFGNNYKNNTIMRGSIRSLADPTVFHTAPDSLVGGISKESYPYFADMTVAASASRAINTQDGGYQAKQYMSGYQSAVLGEKDSDCHSKGYIEFKLTKFNKKMFMYRYIIDNGKLVMLDGETIDKYVGKTVKMRSPMFCTDDKICNKCAGELFFKLGIENAGLTTTKATGVILNSSMKAFHDTSLKINKIDPFQYF